MPPKKAKKTKKQIEEEKSKPYIVLGYITPSLYQLFNIEFRETGRGETHHGRVGAQKAGRRR